MATRAKRRTKKAPPGLTAKGRPRRPIGQPPKLLKDNIRERVLQAIRRGCSYKNACIAGGITEACFYDWKAKAEDPEQDPCYSEFAKELDRARAEGESRLVELMEVHAVEDPRAAQFILERRHPEEWGRRDHIAHEHSTAKEAPRIIVEVVAAIPEAEASGEHVVADTEADES